MLGGVIRFLVFVGGGVLAVYVLYVLYFYTAQRSMLFPRHFIAPAPAVFMAEDALDLGVETGDGRVEAWLLWPHTAAGPRAPEGYPGYPLVIVGHGNAEIIDYWVDAVEPLRRAGAAVLLVEYPGYGRSAGAPTERGIVEVFVAAYDAAVAQDEIDGDRVLLFGRSVGGGAVAQLAVRRPSASMVLFSTFTSVRDMASLYHLPGILARDPFDTLAVVGTYDRPLLLLHGREDPIIPFEHARRLQAAAPHAELRALPCGHNDCVNQWEPFWQQVVGFWQDASVWE